MRLITYRTNIDKEGEKEMGKKRWTKNDWAGFLFIFMFILLFVSLALGILPEIYWLDGGDVMFK